MKKSNLSLKYFNLLPKIRKSMVKKIMTIRKMKKSRNNITTL